MSMHSNSFFELTQEQLFVASEFSMGFLQAIFKSTLKLIASVILVCLMADSFIGSVSEEPSWPVTDLTWVLRLLLGLDYVILQGYCYYLSS